MANWLLNKVGLGSDPKDTFGFTVGERVGEVGLWDLHAGTRKSDGEAMSILIFDKARNGKHAALGMNAFNSMKRLRHPAMVHFVDGKESSDKLFVVTEVVRPLRQVLPGLQDGHPGVLAWGLHEVVRAVHFLNSDCSLVHGFLTVDTVLVNRAMDWKVAGLELVSDTSKKDQPLEHCHSLLPDVYKPPELTDGTGLWLALCKSPRTYDPWLLGCFISQVYHNNAGPFRGEQQLKDMTPIPTGLRDEYKDLLRPYQRRSMENLLGSRYFKDDYVQSMLFLDTIALKDDYEKDQFFKRLQPLIQALPVEVSRYKILPELVKGLDYGTANFRVLGPILEIGEGMTEDEYKVCLWRFCVPFFCSFSVQRSVGQSVVKWFASPDRSLRRNLLEHLAVILARVDPATVNDKIFPLVADGFEDKSPILREMTVKAVLTLAPKLKPQTLETDVLKHFARLQLDAEPGIRTNTTICLGKIAEFLTPQTRQKVLASAFVRALKDHFPPSRLAGVMSLNATAALYSVQEVAKKIIPALSHMTIDADPRVREEAFRAIKQFIAVLEGQYREMSDDQYVKEATRDTTERTVLDWASGLVGKATQHVTAVAANKVLGTPMPKAAPPPPKYSEDHVRAVAEQVRAEAAPSPARPAQQQQAGKKQAGDWGEAFEATAEPPERPAAGGLKISAAPAAAAAPRVVISDGWGDVDEDKWSDDDGGGADDDAGWSTVYRSQPAAGKPAVAPVVMPVPAPVKQVPPPVKQTPVAAPVSAKQPQPQPQPASTSAGLPPLKAPPAAAGSAFAPRPTLGQLQQGNGGLPPALSPAPAPAAFVPASAFVSTLPPAPAVSVGGGVGGGGGGSGAPASAWESFSFGAPASPAAGAASTDGWGDLSFLETKKPAASGADATSSKSTKKTKKHNK